MALSGIQATALLGVSLLAAGCSSAPVPPTFARLHRSGMPSQAAVVAAPIGTGLEAVRVSGGGAEDAAPPRIRRRARTAPVQRVDTELVSEPETTASVSTEAPAGARTRSREEIEAAQSAMERRDEEASRRAIGSICRGC